MKAFFMFLGLFASFSYAAIPPGQWLCFAFDAHKKSYEGLGQTLEKSMSAARSQCQKQAIKQKCKTAQSYCEQGPLSLIEDRCLVSDDTGRSWNATGQDACKTALSLCTEWQFLHGKSYQCSVKHR